MKVNHNKDFFNEKAAVWDDMVFHDPKKVSFIINGLGLKPTDRVLDVGCGTGVLAPYLCDKCGSVLAIDEAEKMIEIALKKHDYKNVRFEAVEFEKVSGIYDIIIMYTMFPHFRDKQKALTHAASLLKKGGSLTVAHSQSRRAINGIHESPECKLPTVQEFAILFENAGLKPEKATDNEDMFIVKGIKTN